MRLNAGWVYFGGKSYYAQTGGAFFRSQIITFGVDIAYYVGLDGSVRSGLIDYKGDSYYFDEKNGDKRIFGVKEINNKLYYFDRQNQGKQIKNVGWIVDGSKRYYAKVGGELFRNEMISFGSDYMYYMGNDGSVQSGIRELSDGRLFYFDPSDNSNIRRWKGWLYSDGKRYYTAQGGELYKNQMITFGANVGYYMGEDGSVQIGVRAVGKNYYKFDGYGSYTMAGHFEYKNGKTYYYDYNGKMVTDWYFIDGAKYFFNPIGEMIGKGPVKKAIDISEHNKIIDWDTVKREGDIDFVILRVGFGSYSEDKMFERNLRELRRIGMPFQIYLYSYAENAAEAKAEARFVDSMMKKYKIDKNTKIYYDIEKPEYINNTEIIITKDQYLQIIPTFMNELTSLGYKDLSLYSYRYYLETVLNSPVILKYVTWVAEYGNNLLYKGDYTGWQYSSNGAVPGISTRVDLNVFFN